MACTDYSAFLFCGSVWKQKKSFLHSSQKFKISTVVCPGIVSIGILSTQPFTHAWVD